ncbi:hypothetical protein R1sor_006189 [Riccia sorocarpa]|uniref:Uncharacterized protein n=1 Tax=Riccia sorocarpa TaxID=122646 RepID=A0ABD3HLP2_9MARC
MNRACSLRVAFAVGCDHSRSRLHDALWPDWSRPEEGTEFVKEFVLNWDDNRQSSMVDGQVVPVNVSVIFGLEEGRTVPRSARHYEDLSD